MGGGAEPVWGELEGIGLAAVGTAQRSRPDRGGGGDSRPDNGDSRRKAGRGLMRLVQNATAGMLVQRGEGSRAESRAEQREERRGGTLMRGFGGRTEPPLTPSRAERLITKRPSVFFAVAPPCTTC